ncbi:MAG: cell division protein ZapA [Beijerinckiaceae bacterium]|nr:cell division protein ZapA [Beijerinckiaceae bacterium]
MAQVNVTIAGRAFRMACADGEEERLESLARVVETKIDEMRGSFGEIGDQRLTVMAAITLADELTETQKKIVDLQSEIDDLKDAQHALAARSDEQALELAHAVEAAARRIEDITQKMNADGRRARGRSAAGLATRRRHAGEGRRPRQAARAASSITSHFPGRRRRSGVQRRTRNSGNAHAPVALCSLPWIQIPAFAGMTPVCPARVCAPQTAGPMEVGC